MQIVAGKSKSILDEPFTYCPGCSHGIAHRLMAESLDELNMRDDAVCVSSIGCSVRIWKFLDFDFVQGPHGRGLAIATGIKRSEPNKIVVSYQGDGDLTAIGMAETIHAAARGENISVIFINNSVFGATGGQMAPTTLVGQKTVTFPDGRDPSAMGYPMHLSEMLAQLPATTYLARCALDTPAHIREAKACIKKALELQRDGKGFGLVELLAACPSNLKLGPVDAMKWVGENMIPVYPLGELKLSTDEKEDEDDFV